MSHKLTFLISFSLLLVLSGGSSAGTIHVGLGGGYTHNTIQSGVDAAFTGDTVLVHNGTYTGIGNRNIDFQGKNINLKSVNGRQNTTIDLQNSSRAFHFHSGETRDAVVDGFNIVNGLVSNNGGAIYSFNSSPTIKNSRFYNNRTTGDTKGGAIYFTSGANGAIMNSIFDSNEGRHGGAVAARDGSDILVSGSLFQYNHSRYDGGGMWTRYSTVDVESSIFRYNTGGGGVRFDVGECSVTNSLFYGNQSTYAGGIRLDNGHLTIMHTTVTGNILADSYGGGVFMGSTGELTMIDSIVWGNDHSSVYLHQESSVRSITYSDIEGGWAGLGNIDADPLFLDALAEDFRISLMSPAADAGTDAGVYVDLNGMMRPFDIPGVDNNGPLADFDMGAYEAIPEPSVMLLVVVGFSAFIARRKRAGN